MDYIAFCRNYFDVTKIPVSLLKSGYVAYSSIAEHLSIEPQTFWQMWPSEQNPEFCYLSPDIEYGRVTVENTDYEVILGPAFNLPLTEEVLREYMREQALSLECREIMAEYLYTIPLISHRQLARHLNLIFINRIRPFWQAGKSSIYSSFWTTRKMKICITATILKWNYISIYGMAGKKG